MGWTAMIGSDFFIAGGIQAESVTWKQSLVETEALTKGLKFMTFKFFLTMKSWDVPCCQGKHQPEAQAQRPYTLHLCFTVGAMVSPQDTQLSHPSLFPLTGEALGKLCSRVRDLPGWAYGT